MTAALEASDRAAIQKELQQSTFDLVVIGGGITGAGVAREAALRGLRVALLERADFASGTSSRSTRLIHGGLRYLRQGDFGLVREAVRERQALLEMAPHLVWPTPFLFPVYRGDPDPLPLLRLGLFVYDRFAAGPVAVPHRVLSPAAVRAEEPSLRGESLVGGMRYTDARTHDARLTLEVVQSAVAAGAVALSYAPVVGLDRDPRGRVRGVIASDALAGGEWTVAGRRVLAAAGPWGDAVRRLSDPAAPSLLRLTRGVHLAVAARRLPLTHAVVMRGPDGRLMFAVPYGDCTYLGTTDTDHQGPLEPLAARAAEVRYILEAARRAFPEAALGEEDVRSTWTGLRPLVRPRGARSPSATSRDYALFTGADGLTSVAGGKLTAFRAMAADIVSRLFPETRALDAKGLSRQPLPGAQGASSAREVVESLAERTGTPAPQAWQWAGELGSAVPHLAADLPQGPAPDPRWAWHRALLRHAVRREMAQRLVDVYFRRTRLALFEADHGLPYVDSLAQEMGHLLGWSPGRTADEAEACRMAIADMDRWRNEDGGSNDG